MNTTDETTMFCETCGCLSCACTEYAVAEKELRLASAAAAVARIEASVAAEERRFSQSDRAILKQVRQGMSEMLRIPAAGDHYSDCE